MLLAQPAHGQHDAAVHQPEIAGIERNIHVGDAADQAVEERGRPELEPSFALALGAHGVGDVVALAPLLDHPQHHFGRVLQVGVHDDHRIAVGKVHAGGDRDLMAKIAAEVRAP